jgi:hypothetical protein
LGHIRDGQRIRCGNASTHTEKCGGKAANTQKSQQVRGHGADVKGRC